MSASDYVLRMRKQIGHDLLMLQAATAMLFDDEGRLLLVHSAETGEWLTVGGAIDPEEQPSDAAVRECWEETGLIVEPVELMGVFGGSSMHINYKNGDLAAYLTIVFKVRLVGGQPHADGEEVTEMRYFTREECAALPLNTAARLLVTRAFEYDGRPWFEPAVGLLADAK